MEAMSMKGSTDIAELERIALTGKGAIIRKYAVSACTL